MAGLVSMSNGVALVWAHWMVSMSWQIVVLAMGAAVISLALRRRSAGLRCLIWLMVFAKLILPPWLATPWSAGNVVAALPLGIEWRQSPAMDAGSATRVSHTAPDAASTVPERETPEPGPIGGSPEVKMEPVIWVMGAWLAGVFAMMGLIAAQYLKYARTVLSSLSPAPEAVLHAFDAQRAAMGVWTPATVSLSERVDTPCVFGVWRAQIILPAHWEEQFSETELSGVLAHELAHVKRGDLLISWGISLLTCLYWFHPAVWLSNVYFRREREIACDDVALLATQQPGKEYASAILRAVESSQARVPVAVGLLGLLELSDNLLYRIRSIGDERRVRRSGWGAVVLLMLVALCLPMGDWSTSAAQTRGAEVPAAVKAPEPAPAVPAATAAAEVAAVPQAAPTKEVRLGVAVLEFACVGAKDRLGDVAAQLHELVTERLANDPAIRLVDRAKIEQAMGEVKLDQSGLVDAATAVRLGSVVGARVLVAGKVMNVDGAWTVTARLIDTQTSELSAVRVTGAESAGVVHLAEETGAAIANRLKELTGAKASAPEQDPLNEEIAQLQRELSGRVLPRVVVTVPESHIGTWVPDPAGENEIVSVLTRAGFPVVDVSTFMKRPESSWWLNIFHGPAQQRSGTEISVTEGFRGAADILHDQRLDRLKQNADVLVMGAAFSEYAGDNYGFKSCRARIEIKALDTASETLAAALSQHATAADTAEHIAGKAALRNAGRELGLQLARALSTYWEKEKDERGNSK